MTPPSRRRKLTPEQIAEIRDNPVGLSVLAKHYGVDRKTIWYIKNGYTYKEEKKNDVQ